jgi:hypothetical protein
MNVFEWLKGTLRPAREMRAKIYAAYEIDPDAWDQRLGSDGKKKSLPAKPEPPPLDTSLEPPSALQDCLDVLAKLRAQRGTNLIASELTKLADIELKYHALRAKLEREGALREDKFVHEHPAWLRLKRVILDALAKHPEALRAVCTAIDTVQSTERSQAS